VAKTESIVMKPDKLETPAIQPKHHDRHEDLPTHLEDYLGHYLSLDKPGYAVLVTDEWGAGKTYQVKGLIPQADRYYVSLFGVQTVEQIHAEVFCSCLTKIGSR
jgi:hypothetical protein